jgi:hypothetical protein
MANMEFSIPLKGYNAGVNVENQPPDTTGDMLNMRAIGSLARRFRLVQRPAKAKVKTQQIAGVASPIVVLGSISVVDYVGTT